MMTLPWGTWRRENFRVRFPTSNNRVTVQMQSMECSCLFSARAWTRMPLLEPLKELQNRWAKHLKFWTFERTWLHLEVDYYYPVKASNGFIVCQPSEREALISLLFCTFSSLLVTPSRYLCVDVTPSRYLCVDVTPSRYLCVDVTPSR